MLHFNDYSKIKGKISNQRKIWSTATKVFGLLQLYEFIVLLEKEI